ncbi:hypothetical protein KKF91_13275 [Myxococcota bacterium]|nr:hypothetical protein [Myxococcota bacterium]MBU1431508.1 hypothetical protein [Myxococcota bacterium]MBU1898161.1 hypothetical protein [Myxococcota bacterium]
MDPLQLGIASMGSVVIDLDATFFIQIAVILGLMSLLNKLVFTPFLDTLAKREAQTTQTRAKALEIQAKAEALSAEYAEGLASARAKAAAARYTLRAEAVEAKVELVEAARAEASEVIEGTRRDLEAQLEVAYAALSTQVEALSGVILSKALGREVSDA